MTPAFAGILVAFIFLLPVGAWSQTWFEPNNVLNLAGVRFNIEPYVQLRIDDQTYETLSFSTTTTQYPDSCVVAYDNPKFSFDLIVSTYNNFDSTAKRVSVRSIAHDSIKIRDFKLHLEFLNDEAVHVFRVPKAIFAQDQSYNTQLTNFTDKVIQYNIGSSKLWLVASNYEGCSNVDMLQERTVGLYDHLCHLARLYNPNTEQFTQMIDSLKRNPGDRTNWSFLIFEEQPVILNINRWMDNKKAALVITNDADGESDPKLRAVYFGSNNVNSPKYKTTGLIANNIKLTNTVFGASKPVLNALWHELVDYGNTIGYHTHTPVTDLSQDIYNSLNVSLSDFNIRTWIDHSWANNLEDLCHQGGNPDSPYYIIDAINDSNLDYFWLGDNLSTNPFNSFTEPGRLPHRLYEFDTLTRPLWFFGRAKMQAWEYYGWNFQSDMKHNLTPENLDTLLNEGGLCVSYTHFGFDESANISAFFEYNDAGDCEIKDEVNDRFALLDYYQTHRGLWIDTLENVFDRMIAMEDLVVSSISRTRSGNVASITLTNKSNYPLERTRIKYINQDITLPLLAPNSSYILSLTGETDETSPAALLYTYYQNKSLHIVRSDNEYIQPLHIKIYNLKGQFVTSHQMPKQTKHVSIPLENLASGVYFSRIEDGMGFGKTLKFSIIK